LAILARQLSPDHLEIPAIHGRWRRLTWLPKEQRMVFIQTHLVGG
jgi:hypothetical protein